MQEQTEFEEEQLSLQRIHHDKQLVEMKQYLEKTVTIRVRITQDIINLRRIEEECANQKIYH